MVTDVPLSLGVFTAARRIGRGGSGEAWLGQHRPSGADVVLKIPHAPAGGEAAAFRRIQAEAAIASEVTGPHVLGVLDFGRVTPAESAASRTRLLAGQPYLVLPYASLGSLAGYVGRLPFEATRVVLLDVLRGLSTLHAREVVHRDIKPANVLLFLPEGPLSIRAVVADLGFALVPRRTEPLGARGGTPGYMAPEQHTGRLRDLGPWTDLYAVGLLAAELVAAPERPPAFDAWIAALTAEEPRERPRSAAEAAHWLGVMGGAPSLVASPAERRALAEGIAAARAAAAPREVDAGALATTAPFAEVLDVAPAGEAPGGAGRAARGARPVFVPSLVFLDEPLPPPLPPGLGAGVCALRRPPLVGQQDLRAALWEALTEACRARAPRGVIVTGPVGAGRSRLAGWLAESAHERLGARTIHVEGRDGDGLGALWERAFAGLSPRGGARVAPTTEERRAALLAWLAALAADALAVVVVIDDAEADPEAVALAADALDTPDGRLGPVMFVLAQRPEARAPAAAALAALGARPRVRACPVPPLTDAETERLLASFIGSDERTRQRIAARAEGSPLFACQLVRDWVQRGLLVPAARGLALAGPEPPIPDSLVALFQDELSAVLAARDETFGRAVALAVLLGGDDGRGCFSRACALAGVSPPPDLAEVLLDAGLAVRAPGGFLLSHAIVCEVVERRLEGDPQLAALHLACAEARFGARGACRMRPRAALAAARHFERAGEPERAIEALQATSFVDQGAADAAAMLDLLDGLVSRLAARPRALPALWALAARAHYQRGDSAQAEAAARRALAADLPSDDPRARFDALLALGAAATSRGAIDEALALADELEALAARLGDPTDALLAAMQRGRAEFVGCRPAACLATVDATLARSEGADPRVIARARTVAADAALLAGLLDDAARRCEQVLVDLGEGAAGHLAAHVLVTLADVEVRRGRFDAAIQWSRKAAAAAHHRAPVVGYARGNAAYAMLRAGRVGEARAEAEAALADLPEGQRHRLWFFLTGLLLPSLAAEDDLALFDARFEAFEAFSRTTQVSLVECAEALRMALWTLEARGEASRAAAARALADELFRRLGRAGEARLPSC
ncbi:serine/threonine-protein kinase [Polyangium spumosum]|uniref:Protein kinase n=1 Tax=Polyangium spumosum TaxID=889282 RepID=A0A6N7PS21_9BACT|nr:serine/threonine-protein kinase [Polyangium spumosum]MRG94729.1 protein kinase [Polyangium spumosum]